MSRILDALTGTSPVTRAATTGLAPVGTVATSEGALRELDPAAAAAFGIPTESGPVTREVAMTVPAVRRGRALIAGTIGTLPLVCLRTTAAGAVEVVQRQLLRQLDPRTTPAYTLTWTVDDLMFRGVSWWRVLARDSTGYPSEAERLAPSRVAVQLPTADSLGRVYVDGAETPDSELIRFDGPDEGILAYGGAVIRLALSLLRAAQRSADNDVPTGKLTPREGATELSPLPGTATDGSGRSAVEQLLSTWEAARRQRTTAYLNGAVDYDTVGFNAQERQLTELQNVVSSELARLLNLPASRIGAPQGSGMTYTNTEADRRDLVDTTLAQYLAPIYQRLSLGDVTPAGQSVVVDLTAYLRGTTTELVAAGVAAVDAHLASRAEVRTSWLGLPPNPAVTDAEPATEPAAPAERNPEQ